MSASPLPDGIGLLARTVRLRLVVRLCAIHAAGGLVVFGYLQTTYPASVALATPWLNDLALVVCTELAMFPLCWYLTHRHYTTSAGWAFQGRPPTRDEQARILDEPWRMAARPFGLWVLGGGAIAVAITTRDALSTREILDTVQITVLGALATCAVSYLVIEQTFRPMFSVALSGNAPERPSSLGIRPRLVFAWAVASGVPFVGLALVPFREAGTSGLAIATLAVIGLVGGLFTMMLAADSIADPLDGVRDALSRVERGDLEVDLPVDDGGEVGQVQAGFNRMVAGLRERDRIEDLFGRHVGQEVAAQALERDTGIGGESRRASVIFVDLIGSTAMAEVLPPGEVVATLNAFFAAVVDTVQSEGGWVNKFEGDGALCIFGVPGFQPDHEARALRAARRLHTALTELAVDHPGMDAGIGVSTGTVVAGNVGTDQRYEYTVIGRAVNEAARLTDLAKTRSGRVLASGRSVRAAAEERSHWVDRGRAALRGQQEPTALFEPAMRRARRSTEPLR